MVLEKVDPEGQAVICELCGREVPLLFRVAVSAGKHMADVCQRCRTEESSPYGYRWVDGRGEVKRKTGHMARRGDICTCELTIRPYWEGREAVSGKDVLGKMDSARKMLFWSWSIINAMAMEAANTPGREAEAERLKEMASQVKSLKDRLEAGENPTTMIAEVRELAARLLDELP